MTKMPNLSTATNHTQQTIAFHVDHLTVNHGVAKNGSPIQDFNLKINQNEITCILGKSGCGKTTLLKCLGGFVVGEPSGGVLYNGQFLENQTPDIVMVFQENNLFPWLNVIDNVRFGLKFKPEITAQDKAIRIDDMLHIVGLTEAIKKFPHQLSGGMQQRTAIARALISDPKVLLLDEPFSALDVSLRRRMQNLLLQLWQTSGKTMVMVTHNVEEAISVGHRVIVLGNNPVEVLMDIRTDSDAYHDRYSSTFLDLQRTIEEHIY